MGTAPNEPAPATFPQDYFTLLPERRGRFRAQLLRRHAPQTHAVSRLLFFVAVMGQPHSQTGLPDLAFVHQNDLSADVACPVGGSFFRRA